MPVKRSVVVAGHATSVTLEPAFWRELEAAARRRGRSLNGLVSDIDAARSGEAAGVTLATALRRFVLSELTR